MEQSIDITSDTPPPQQALSRPRITLRQGRDLSVRRGHPWVFSGAVHKKEGTLQRGCLVDIFSNDGELLGVGHWGTRGIAVRMLGFGKFDSEEKLVQHRIEKAAQLRIQIGLIGNAETNAFRLVNAEGDFLPGLVVDIYGSIAVVQCHSAGMWRLRQHICAVLLGLQKCSISRCVVKRYESDPSIDEPRSMDSLEGDDSSGPITISENGFQFLVDLKEGQKTGFFLDQRANRELIQKYSQGKNVLNAFSYTGAFSVYALGGGASWVCSVDASKPAMDLCRQNVTLNFPAANHTGEVADCFKFLETIGDTYQVIILDPPAFAKHQKAIERGVRGYETINSLAFKGLKPGGILFTFSCSQHVSRGVFRDAVLRASSHAGRRVRVLHELHAAPCHPTSLHHSEGEYLKGFVLMVEE